MTDTDSMRKALVAADPRLSRYNPLPRILFFDDFDEGINGWTELIGNHDGDPNKIRPIVGDMRPAQLSNLSFWDVGTHGTVDGNYALKLATRAKANHMAAGGSWTLYAAGDIAQGRVERGEDVDTEFLGWLLRLAYVTGYWDALSEGERGVLCRQLGYPVPERRTAPAAVQAVPAGAAD